MFSQISYYSELSFFICIPDFIFPNAKTFNNNKYREIIFLRARRNIFCKMPFLTSLAILQFAELEIYKAMIEMYSRKYGIIETERKPFVWFSLNVYSSTELKSKFYYIAYLHPLRQISLCLSFSNIKTANVYIYIHTLVYIYLYVSATVGYSLRPISHCFSGNFAQGVATGATEIKTSESRTLHYYFPLNLPITNILLM